MFRPNLDINNYRNKDITIQLNDWNSGDKFVIDDSDSESNSGSDDEMFFKKNVYFLLKHMGELTMEIQFV